MKTTQLTKPNEYQLRSVVSVIQNELLRDWDVSDIGNGIKRVCANEIGDVTDVYVAPGLWGTLCFYRYGNRTRKPFFLNTFMVKQWKPNTQQLHRGKK